MTRKADVGEGNFIDREFSKEFFVHYFFVTLWFVLLQRLLVIIYYDLLVIRCVYGDFS